MSFFKSIFWFDPGPSNDKKIYKLNLFFHISKGHKVTSSINAVTGHQRVIITDAGITYGERYYNELGNIQRWERTSEAKIITPKDATDQEIKILGNVSRLLKEKIFAEGLWSQEFETLFNKMLDEYGTINDPNRKKIKEFIVATCKDNAGFEEHFEVGVDYLVKGRDSIHCAVEDMFGDIIQGMEEKRFSFKKVRVEEEELKK